VRYGIMDAAMQKYVAARRDCKRLFQGRRKTRKIASRQVSHPSGLLHCSSPAEALADLFPQHAGSRARLVLAWAAPLPLGVTR
jgi:hypothetical protein